MSLGWFQCPLWLDWFCSGRVAFLNRRAGRKRLHWRATTVVREFERHQLMMLASLRCLTATWCLKKNPIISLDASGPAGSV